jgi:hypothetical protein
VNKAVFEKSLIEFAAALIARAADAKLEDSVRVFKEVRDFYAILTRGAEPGDKVAGRRSTMTSMRKRIDAAGGMSNGRAEPTIPNTGG